MKAEIIAVGTELLLGDILNTNAKFLANELANLGITLQFQTVVGDNEGRMLDAFRIAFERADIVITTGGLGPTDDDITKETAAKFFNKELYLHEESMHKLLTLFKGRDMPKSNLKQVYMPSDCIVINNNNGTAPGCIIEDKGKTIIILPGPPKELTPMFNESIRPFLEQKANITLVSKVLHLSGIGESAAAEAIQDIMKNGTNPTIAPYAKENETRFRVTAMGKNKEECHLLIKPIVDQIYNKLAKYIYGEDDETLVDVVMQKIISLGYTISVAESCTGGLVSARLIDYPGASNAFINGITAYSNESKIRLLNIDESVLDKYGAVSEQTATAMCQNIAQINNTNIGICTTGIAGPSGGSDDKPVGLVYLGVSINGNTKIKKMHFNGNRSRIRNSATAALIEMLRQELNNI